jgi:thiamine-monophosphate kinase
LKVNEFDLIDLFTSYFRTRPPPRGPGDDAAYVPDLRNLCVTTDVIVENVHFERRFFSAEEIGHKALAVNLSDLAAMGAKPAWFLVSLCLPERTLESEIRGMALGMSRLARSLRIELVGGNVSKAGELSISICAAGTARRPLTRSGGRPGDVLYLSGTMGDARLGLKLLRASGGPRLNEPVRRQKRPHPRVRLGLIAARFARAAIDISDGFAQDLAHLCKASRLGAIVNVDRLPLSRGVRATFGAGAVDWALAGGEDYELLIAVAPSRATAFERECARVGEKITRVGQLTAARKILFQGAGGKSHTMPAGYDHFRPFD